MKDIEKKLFDELDLMTPKMSDKLLNHPITKSEQPVVRHFNKPLIGSLCTVFAAFLVVMIIVIASLGNNTQKPGEPTGSVPTGSIPTTIVPTVVPSTTIPGTTSPTTKPTTSIPDDAIDYGYFIIEINPTIYIAVNKENVVIDCKSGNADADELLADINLIGKSLTEGIVTIADEALKLGYFSGESGNTLKITSVYATDTNFQGIEAALKELFGDDYNVDIQTKSVDSIEFNINGIKVKTKEEFIDAFYNMSNNTYEDILNEETDYVSIYKEQYLDNYLVQTVIYKLNAQISNFVVAKENVKSINTELTNINNVIAEKQAKLDELTENLNGNNVSSLEEEIKVLEEEITKLEAQTELLTQIAEINDSMKWGSFLGYWVLVEWNLIGYADQTKVANMERAIAEYKTLTGVMISSANVLTSETTNTANLLATKESNLADKNSELTDVKNITEQINVINNDLNTLLVSKENKENELEIANSDLELITQIINSFKNIKSSFEAGINETNIDLYINLLESINDNNIDLIKKLIDGPKTKEECLELIYSLIDNLKDTKLNQYSSSYNEEKEIIAVDDYVTLINTIINEYGSLEDYFNSI